MPTTHPRINITLKPDIAVLLTALANDAEQSVSALARELITEALALREDKALSALADSRDDESRTIVIPLKNYPCLQTALRVAHLPQSTHRSATLVFGFG